MLRIFLILSLALAEDDFEISSTSSKLTHKLYHSYDGTNWEERGIIQMTTFGDKRRKPQVSVKNLKFEKEKLKNSEIYYVRVSSPSNASFIQSYTPSCYILGSDLQDIITILYDPDSEGIVFLNYKPESRICEKSSTALKLQTAAEVVSTKEAIKPYFAPPKIENVDDRSFFSKYWWAILIGLFFFISSAAAPQPGQS